jgi:hypothetical protein
MQLTMSSMQQFISAMQLEVHSINLRVKQNQIDLRECLKFHHLSNSDDEDDAPMAEPTCAYFVLLLFYSFDTFMLSF